MKKRQLDGDGGQALEKTASGEEANYLLKLTSEGKNEHGRLMSRLQTKNARGRKI